MHLQVVLLLDRNGTAILGYMDCWTENEYVGVWLSSQSGGSFLDFGVFVTE